MRYSVSSSEQSGYDTANERPLRAASRAPMDPATAYLRSLGSQLRNRELGRLLRGMDGGPRALADFPHRAGIERSTGLSIRGAAVLDPAACNEMRVPAFTDGAVTHFASSAPPIEVAAHEAAHQMQHAGATRDAHLGPEVHAGAVADAVARGATAGHLLGARGAPVASGVRPYTEIPQKKLPVDGWSFDQMVRLSYDRTLACEQERTEGSQRAFAKPELIAAANRKLTAISSVVRLAEGTEQRTGHTVGGATQTLKKVEPTNTATKSNDVMTIWADCGKAARDIIGTGLGTGEVMRPLLAVHRQIHEPTVIDRVIRAVWGTQIPETELVETIDVFVALMGGQYEEAEERYKALPGPQRERFDRMAGIGRYTQPDVGEAYRVRSGGNPVNSKTWNFHWGAVVLVSADGLDRIALENYAEPSGPDKNSAWSFQMYGPADAGGETFQEQHQASGAHGDNPATERLRLKSR